jgi:hypothetical protein
VLSAAELRPPRARGWDSNPRLELMRLARKAAPPPRSNQRSGRQESNLRSPVPETGGVPEPPTTRNETPGGTRTRSFRAENPASSRSTTGARRGSGGRARTCASRVTVARLTSSTTPERSGGSRIRTCGRLTPPRGSNALLSQLSHASGSRVRRASSLPAARGSGRRGSRTPKAAKPTRFRDGIPRLLAVLPWPRQASNLHFPG